MRTEGLTALVLLLAAGVGRAEPLQAQVVDARTGQPIEGAVVLGTWKGAAGNPMQTEGETDDLASFSLSRPGHVVWTNVEAFQPTEQPPWYRPRPDTSIPPRIMLEPFPAHGNHARHLWFIDAATGASGTRP